MESIYKKMYVTLVGRVDETLALLADCLLHSRCDWDHTRQVADQLKVALLEVEDMYLDTEEEE